MEYKKIQGILFNKYSDTLYKGDFGLVLTASSVEKVKFPTSFNNYKSAHLMQSNMIFEAELIKTKKNWIVNSINSSYTYYKPIDYQDFLAFTQCMSELRNNLRENQDIKILSKLLQFFKTCERVQASQFHRELLQWLGF